MNLSGLGVVHWHATSADEARKLIEFLLEPSQQEVFAQNNHEFPVVAGARPRPGDRPASAPSSAT